MPVLPSTRSTGWTQTRVDPDTLLRKILKRIVGGKLGHKTSGRGSRVQSPEQKRPEINELGHRPAPDIGGHRFVDVGVMGP